MKLIDFTLSKNFLVGSVVFTSSFFYFCLLQTMFPMTMMNILLPIKAMLN